MKRLTRVDVPDNDTTACGSQDRFVVGAECGAESLRTALETMKHLPGLGIPQIDRHILGSGQKLVAIGAELDTVYPTCMSCKAADSFCRLHVPQEEIAF